MGTCYIIAPMYRESPVGIHHRGLGMGRRHALLWRLSRKTSVLRRATYALSTPWLRDLSCCGHWRVLPWGWLPSGPVLECPTRRVRTRPKGSQHPRGSKQSP